MKLHLATVNDKKKRTRNWYFLTLSRPDYRGRTLVEMSSPHRLHQEDRVARAGSSPRDQSISGAIDRAPLSRNDLSAISFSMECPEAVERGRNFRLLAEEELSQLLDVLTGYLPESLKVRARCIPSQIASASCYLQLQLQGCVLHIRWLCLRIAQSDTSRLPPSSHPPSPDLPVNC